MMKLSLSGGFNASATGQSIPGPVNVGGEWLATAASDRALPTSLTGVSDFTQLNQTQINGIIRQMPRDWVFSDASGHPNASGSLSFGGESPLVGQRFGYIGSLSYSRSQSVRDGEIRARAVPGDSLGTPKPYNAFTGSTGQSSVLWGGLLNLSAYLGRGTKVELNNTYDRTADNVAHMDWGTLEEFTQIQRAAHVAALRRADGALQPAQGGAPAERQEQGVLGRDVLRRLQDRARPDEHGVRVRVRATGERLPLAWLGFISEAAKRTAADLTENSLSGRADYSLSLGAADRETTLKVGGSYRHTSRDSETNSYNLRAVGLTPEERAASPDQLFYGAFTDGDVRKITLEPNTAGGTYGATDDVAAGYAMAEVPLGARLRLIGGARVEKWTLGMDVTPVSGQGVRVDRGNTDVLPSLALNARLSGSQTLRVSASQTLSRPEYRELAPISYRDMLGEREVFGDSSLVRTLVQNYDVRWEWYPEVDEVLSIALFAKHFDKPIEQIDVATSGVSQLSYINAASAFNYGVELELRKRLGFLADALAPFGVFANVTLMKSRINTSNSTLSALTNDERPMVGQAPYVVNAGLSYAGASSALSATLLYNVVGKRITTAAVTPIRVDTYEQPRQLLDFSVRFPLAAGMAGKLDAKNLLNSPYEELQGDVVRFRYRTGREFSLGVAYTLR